MNKIIKINKDLLTVKLENGNTIDCKIRGKFRNINIRPLVGDNVIVDEKLKTIESILERKNELDRPLISNIDKLLIVVSTTIPKFSSFLLDKFLIISLANKIEAIIVFTKLDKLTWKEKRNITKYIKYYKSLGFKVYKNTEISKIKKEFTNYTVALAGQTGAGKSTLLNKIDKNLKLETNEVSQALGRGKHTTRLVSLHEVNNGLVADTPGFSSLEFKNITKEQIKESYTDFLPKCKYKTCMHINEQDCEVKKYIKKSKSKILKERYENYTKFIKEVE